MAGRQYQNVSYGLNQPLNLENPSPTVSKRNPTTSDFAFPTALWTNTSTNAVFILASVSNNSANWLSAAGGSGVFTSLTVTPGPISLTGTTSINTTGAATTSIGVGGTGAVNIGNTMGNTAVVGSLTVGGNISSTMGNIAASAGSLSAGTTITAGTGITATLGNIAASSGGVTASGVVTAGTTITAGTGITSTSGNITATAGNVVVTNATSGFVFGTSTIQIVSGTGAPTAVTAPQGSLYLRTDGNSTSTRAYINTDGGTTWTAITTAA